MVSLFSKFLPAVLAVSFVFAIASVPQTLAAASARVSARVQKPVHAKAKIAAHSASQVHAASRVHAAKAFHGTTVAHGNGHGSPKTQMSVRQVHGVGLPRNARMMPAVMHTRRGALAAARRHAHAFDATPRSLQKVRLAMPPPLFGSHDSLVHQNVMAEADGLERIMDDDDLNDRIARGSLVPVPVSGALRINPDLPENRRYCRPWTAKFLKDLARAHSSRFAGGSLDVTSAVRTVEFQRRLRYSNGNAAAADGDIASPHLTGGTIDIAKQGLTSRQIGWIRSWLIPLEQQGKIDVEEEFRQSCFHISVYRNYLAESAAPGGKPNTPLASGSMLAARTR